MSVQSAYGRGERFREIVLNPGEKALPDIIEEKRLGETKGDR